MAKITAHLPDSGVRLVPAAGGGVGQIGGEGLNLRVKRSELLPVGEERVEELAVDVELHLVPGTVADAYRAGVAPATQVTELPLREVMLAPDAVHDLKRALASPPAGRARHEGDELFDLVWAGPDVQGIDRHA